MARAMKDSGIAWIGEIPENWNVMRIKLLRNNEVDSFQDGDWIESPYITDEGIRYLTTGNIGDGVFKRQGNGYITEDTFKELNCKNAYPNDLVISRLNAPYGRACILPIDRDKYVLAVDIVILRTDHDKRFLCYLMQCQGYQNEVQDGAKGTTMKRISRTNLGNISLPIAPLEQQRRIADYLDGECARIDAVIEQTRASIEEYKKLKQAVITQVVTKGIRPNRPMKEACGFETSIPDSWTLVRLKYLTTEIVDCPHETPEYSNDGEYLVIRTADQDYARLRPEENMYRLDLSEYQNRIRRLSLEKDDIVYGREGERWGLACLVPESGKYCLGQRMMQFRCDESRILPMFAVYALSSIYVHRQGEFDTFGSTSPHVNISTIRNYKLPLPPLGEQEEIQSYLDRKTAGIDDIIAKKERYLSEVESFKKSLIFEYVTGKKKVTL